MTFENGIAESVKSCHFHQKGRILWYLSLKNDFKRLDSILNQGGASEARLCLKIQFRPTDV